MGVSPTTLVIHEIKPFSPKQQTVPDFVAHRIVLRAMGFDPTKEDLLPAMLMYFDGQIAQLRKQVGESSDVPGAIKNLVEEKGVETTVVLKATSTILVPKTSCKEVELPLNYVADDLIDHLISKGCKLHSINDQPANRVVKFDFLKRAVLETLEFCDMGILSRDPNLGPALIEMVNGVYTFWSAFQRKADGKMGTVKLTEAGQRRVEEAIVAQKAKTGVSPLLAKNINPGEAQRLAKDLLERLGSGRILG